MIYVSLKRGKTIYTFYMGFEVLLIIFFSFASCKSTLTNSKMSKSKRGTTIYAPLYFLNRWLTNLGISEIAEYHIDPSASVASTS